MTDYRIAIIGAGLGGLGMAMRLRMLGEASFIVLDRAERVGGTWRDNVYPGCACDAPSHFYWYSFDEQPDWTRVYARQPEILDQIDSAVNRYGLDSFVRCNAAVCSLDWDEDAAHWNIGLRSGESFTARFVIGSTGQLSVPSYAGLDGRDEFAGEAFHSSRWPKGLCVEGKRVVVIGGGASAAQIIPEVAKTAAHLTVLQRSPPYVYPRNDREYSLEEREQFKTDVDVREASRHGYFEFFEGLALVVKPDTPEAAEAQAAWRAHMESQISDPALRKMLTPNYTIGCKRALLCDDYYPAFERSNVTLVPQAAQRVVASGVLLADGTGIEADIIVFATGFKSLNFLPGIQVRGRVGDLQDTVWQRGARAYLGMTMPGFPNLFLTYGPNTNITSSIIAMMEAQYEYILQALEFADEQNVDALDVKLDVMERFDGYIQSALAGSSYATGCHSWFVNASGRIVTNWPGNVQSYYAATNAFHPDDYAASKSQKTSKGRKAMAGRI